MAYILCTPDRTQHVAPGGILVRSTEVNPLTFSSPDHAYRMIATQPDFADLVVDAAHE
jgi:hypothetical protein